MKKRPAPPKKNQAPCDKDILPEQLELFSKTYGITLKWPKKGTLAYQVLQRMLNGERLTQISFGTDHWRLSAYVKTLEYLGWPIERQDVPDPRDEKGTIRLYWLDAEIIAEARAVCQQHS